MVKLVNTRDLKSLGLRPSRFKSGSGHQIEVNVNKHLTKVIERTSPLLRKAVLYLWLGLGTLFPIFTLMTDPSIIAPLWIKSPLLAVSAITALIVEFSVIMQLFQANSILERKALKNKELQLEVTNLKIAASTDHLTNIANRRCLTAALEEEFSRSSRNKHDFALISFDLDFFKKVNDNYGHDVGDSILISVSNVVKKELRSFDTFGRQGGEEFLIILPETSLESALEVAERIRAAIENNTECGVAHTASFGVVSRHSVQTENAVTPVEMLKLADLALYDAKHSGRNTVKSAKVE